MSSCGPARFPSPGLLKFLRIHLLDNTLSHAVLNRENAALRAALRATGDVLPVVFGSVSTPYSKRVAATTLARVT